jgi:hypothetical protein
VLQLDATGELLGLWDLPAQLGRFVKPVGVAVGPDGRVWVTDADGGNVIVIEPVEIDRGFGGCGGLSRMKQKFRVDLLHPPNPRSIPISFAEWTLRCGRRRLRMIGLASMVVLGLCLCAPALAQDEPVVRPMDISTPTPAPSARPSAAICR